MTEFLSQVKSKICLPESKWKIIFGTIGVLVVLFLVVFLGSFAYSQSFNNQVFPGVTVGGYSLGGLNGAEVKNFIEGINNRYAKEGIEMVVTDKNGTKHKIKLNTVVAVGDNAIELVRLESDQLVKTALMAGRAGNAWQNIWSPLRLRFLSSGALSAPITVNTSGIENALRSILATYEDAPKNVSLAFAPGSTEPTLVPEKSGRVYKYEEVAKKITDSVAALSFSPLDISLQEFAPTITTSDLEPVLSKLVTIFGYGSLSLNYVNVETKVPADWALAPTDLAQILEVRRDNNNQVIFALNKTATVEYLEQSVRPAVDTPAEEAKFAMDGDKVKEFQTSQTGVAVDSAKTYADLDAAFRARNYNPGEAIRTVPVSVKLVEPTVRTADVTGLGISSIVGVGTSTFKDSHTNRIKNIAHAVERLNGILIKPGEEFSANKSAGPFTAENGFLPEQVIKGNELKPEIGGGMCQIGTTLFRMAMNTGLPITQRRNHSLVVSYYADPVNHNPGTDATLYEPLLDLKFINETNNYLLLQTSIDYKKQMLTFTLWGAPDGRSGSYSRPLVKKWIPAGEPQTTYSDDGKLKPGEQKCQAAFRGAVATFTYTRTTPQGEKIDRVFDSYYRPLPKICVIGVEPGSCAGKKECGPAATSTPAL